MFSKINIYFSPLFLVFSFSDSHFPFCIAVPHCTNISLGKHMCCPEMIFYNGILLLSEHAHGSVEKVEKWRVL